MEMNVEQTERKEIEAKANQAKVVTKGKVNIISIDA